MSQHKIFEPVDLGPVRLRNRVAMAPLTRARATPDGVPKEMHVEYYRQRADAGLIIAEATNISPEGRGYAWTPGIWTDSQVVGWRKVTDAVHEAGGHIYLQLWHVGRVSHADLQPGGALPVAPSAVKANGQSFTEVGLSVTRRMRQRHEHLLATPFTFPDVILDDRVTANKPAFLAKPVKHPLRRMPLLARHRPVRLQPTLDDRDERIKLRALDLGRPSVARRNREHHHLRNRVARYVEFLRRLTLAHASSTGLTNSQI